MTANRTAAALSELVDKLDGVTGKYESARGLPPECYYDEDIFEVERQAIFMREWLCVGRADQIPEPGDYFTITLVGEPLIVVRGDAGTVRVMSSVCRHRGMIVTGPADGERDEWLAETSETKGNAGRGFRCPYHFWMYAPDGKLIGAPQMNRTPCFNQDDPALSLPNFRTELWQGFIFVNFDQQAPSLADRMGPVDELIANWRLSEMATEEPAHLANLPWNWKIMHENSIDVYHVDRLHFPRHAVLPGKGYRPLDVDTKDAAIVFAHIATHKDFALSPIGTPLFPVLANLTDEERERSYVVFLPPTLLIILNSDSAFYRVVHPRSAGVIDIRQTLMVPKAYRDLPNYGDLVEVGSNMHMRLNYQDYMVDAQIQRAAKSIVAPRGPYAWNEDAVSGFDEWVARRYHSGATAGAGSHPAAEVSTPELDFTH
jgi:phenylpropionate dioxygenase-like ring-hydroxylating dioxygenase large terminal subunit